MKNDYQNLWFQCRSPALKARVLVHGLDCEDETAVVETVNIATGSKYQVSCYERNGGMFMCKSGERGLDIIDLTKPIKPEPEKRYYWHIQNKQDVAWRPDQALKESEVRIMYSEDNGYKSIRGEVCPFDDNV